MSPAAPTLPPQQTYDNNSNIRTAVNRLTELVEWLYPEPSPDIFTVRDYRNRYPFTRLGPLATNDIDRYQRINRAIGNHTHLGLCEFHIGLIYLHEGEFRGAVQQFEQARQQWSFVNQTVAIALTYLARAVAWQQADHYEAAMVSAGKVAGWLERTRFAEPMLGWKDFEAQVLAYVRELQLALRKQMGTDPDKTTGDGAKADEPTEEPADTSISQDEAAVDTNSEAETAEATQTTTAGMPISNLNRPIVPLIPVPGHQFIDDRYAWYVVEARPLSNFMPDINPGDWLLVDLKPGINEDFQDTEQSILIMKKENIDGTIRVRPLDTKAPYQRIYLVKLAAPLVGTFRVEEGTGTVDFSPELSRISVNLSEILGLVIGFWRPMIEVMSAGSE